MADEEKLLRSAGLTGTDAKTYLVLLKLGSATGGEIASAGGLYKANAYKSLERLVRLGLAGYVEREGKREKRYFEAADPSRLVQIIEEKKLNSRPCSPAFCSHVISSGNKK